MRLEVLGRLRLQANDGTEFTIPRGKTTALLVLLAGRNGRVVTYGQLIEALWGEDPPRTSTASLHNYVSSLRSVLSQAVPDGERRLRRVFDGYQLDLESSECDLIEFERLVADGRAEARRGETDNAARLLRRALGLWRGIPSLTGGVSTPSFDALVRTWENTRITAYEGCLAAEIRLGRHAEAIPELRELVEKYPLQEQFHGLLMRALWMAGERAEALLAYQAARQSLVDSLGIEPGSDLVELQVKILRGDSPTPAEPPARPGFDLPPSLPVPRQLPADTTDFTGREEIVARVTELLSTAGSVATVTMSGHAGAGKTSTAVHVGHLLADRFPDGQLYLHLGGAAHPRLPGDALAEALRSLGVADAAIPSELEQRAATYRSRLAGRRVLIVLDDAAEVSQVRPLLPGTAGSAVLVTGRRRLLGLPGATSVELPPLAEGESLRLLAKVLGAERVNAEPEAAAGLVELCGGLPLAITVVVARLATRPLWSLSSLLTRMRDQHHLLDELAVAEFDVRAGLAVSHDALGDLERLVFRRFALAGAADLAPWALGALVDEDPGIDNALHELLTSHFFEPAAGRFERYTMHDLVRIFATEQVHSGDGDLDAPETRARAAFWRLFARTRSLIEVAYQRLPRPAGWLMPIGPPSGLAPPAAIRDLVHRDPVSWCTAECEALLGILSRAAALGWRRESLDAVERLSSFLAMKHRVTEVDRLFSALRAAAGDDRLVWARAEFGLGHGDAMGGRPVDASVHLTACAETFGQLGDTSGEMNSLVLLSFCRVTQGEIVSAERLVRRALDISEQVDDRRSEARVLRQLGYVRIHAGDPQGAVGHLRRALEHAQGVGEADLEAIVLSSLSNALIDLGELDQADELYRRAIKLLDELDQPVGRAHVRVSRSRIAERLGRHREAITLIEHSLHVFRQFGDRRGEVNARHRLAINKLALGEVAEATALLRSAQAICHELGMVGMAKALDQALADAGGGH